VTSRAVLCRHLARQLAGPTVARHEDGCSAITGGSPGRAG